MTQEFVLRWAWRARRDLREIGDYVGSDNPQAARRLLEKIRQRTRTSAALPFSGRRVRELNREDVREAVYRNYRIVYLIKDDGILVLTVFEGHQLFPEDLEIDEE